MNRKTVTVTTAEIPEGIELDVHPRVMRRFRLKPGQTVDIDMMCKVLEANRAAFIDDSKANIISED